MKKGFTIIEILISMVLLATIAGMAFTTFSSSSKLSKGGANENVAANLARQQLERLYESVRAQSAPGTDQWNSAGFPLSTATPGPQPGNVTLDTVNYAGKYTVASVDVDGGGEDYRRAQMTVCWNQGTCP